MMKRNLLLGTVLAVGFVLGAAVVHQLDAQPTPMKFTNLLQRFYGSCQGIRGPGHPCQVRSENHHRQAYA
jgi:hypothetical protein